MTFYEELVMQTQTNFSKYYGMYASGKTPYILTKKKPLPYSEQISRLVQELNEADCIVVGGASGLSAAGGGDFYYEDNASYRKYFGRFAEKYGFHGAFAGMQYPFPTREEHWGYVATFLNTTQNAPVREPYLDLDRLLAEKDFFILTTNQDTQFIKLYPKEKVSEIQGDHRFLQCAKCCTDDTWDAVEPVKEMIRAMGNDTYVPSEMIPRCPHCGGEAFPWVRGYGNFLQGKKYEGEYPRDLESRYQKRILEKDVAGALNCANEFFEWMEGQSAVSREDVEIKILELVMDAERRAFFAGTMKYNINDRRGYIRELQACPNMESLRNWFLDKTREIGAKMEDSKEKEAVSVIDRAKEYIDENFRKDISLDDVSREVDISPYYFSKLFKQETGKNFIEHLTEIRLKNARELLQDSQLSIKEICAQSGYSDPNYFSRIFKKYEGVTPSEFRERLG